MGGGGGMGRNLVVNYGRDSVEAGEERMKSGIPKVAARNWEILHHCVILCNRNN